jgi:hypothetical protein
MEAQTVDTLPPVAADHEPVRCLLGIELSKKSWIVAITTALCAFRSHQRFRLRSVRLSDCASAHGWSAYRFHTRINLGSR